eukprot:876410-Prymnesium_polylepis.2
MAVVRTVVWWWHGRHRRGPRQHDWGWKWLVGVRGRRRRLADVLDIRKKAALHHATADSVAAADAINVEGRAGDRDVRIVVVVGRHGVVVHGDIDRLVEGEPCIRLPQRRCFLGHLAVEEKHVASHQDAVRLVDDQTVDAIAVAHILRKLEAPVRIRGGVASDINA